MLDQIAHEPDEFDTADVAAAAGHMKAAHAEGPVTLHEGFETQPPEARVIIGDAILPTKVLSDNPGRPATGERRPRGTILLAGVALVAVVITISMVVFRNQRVSGTAPVESALPASHAAAQRVLENSTSTPPTPPTNAPSAMVPPADSTAALPAGVSVPTTPASPTVTGTTGAANAAAAEAAHLAGSAARTPDVPTAKAPIVTRPPPLGGPAPRPVAKPRSGQHSPQTTLPSSSPSSAPSAARTGESVGPQSAPSDFLPRGF